MCVADVYHVIVVCPALHSLRTEMFWELQQHNASSVRCFMCHPDRFAAGGFFCKLCVYTPYLHKLREPFRFYMFSLGHRQPLGVVVSR
jgi:hypothetical protein